jgi:hypothetical protein
MTVAWALRMHTFIHVTTKSFTSEQSPLYEFKVIHLRAKSFIRVQSHSLESKVLYTSSKSFTWEQSPSDVSWMLIPSFPSTHMHTLIPIHMHAYPHGSSHTHTHTHTHTRVQYLHSRRLLRGHSMRKNPARFTRKKWQTGGIVRRSCLLGESDVWWQRHHEFHSAVVSAYERFASGTAACAICSSFVALRTVWWRWNLDLFLRYIAVVVNRSKCGRNAFSMKVLKCGFHESFECVFHESFECVFHESFECVFHESFKMRFPWKL